MYGQFPVRRGIATGKNARIIGLGMILMALLELFVPEDFGILYACFEAAYVAAVYFSVEGDSDKSM